MRTFADEVMPTLMPMFAALVERDVAVLAAQHRVAADEHPVAQRDARVGRALRVETAVVVDDHAVADEDLAG
jgi:hypothetical protein